MNTTSSKILKFLIYLMIVGIVIIMLVISYRLRAESDQSKKEAQQLELKHDVLASPTPIKPISSCLILEEKYCKQGVKLLYNNKYPMIGLNLPANTNLYAPLSGNISLSTAIFKKNNQSYPYTSLLIESPNNAIYALVFNYDPQKQKQGSVKQNQTVANLTTKKIDYFGDYNLIVYVMKKEKNLLTIDVEKTLKLFKLN